jgi:hypothetical protein
VRLPPDAVLPVRTRRFHHCRRAGAPRLPPPRGSDSQVSQLSSSTLMAIPTSVGER